MDEFGIESESESESLLSVGPIHPKLWEHWAWAGLGLGLLLLCFLLWPPPLAAWVRVPCSGWPSMSLPCPSSARAFFYSISMYLWMDHSEILLYLCSNYTAMFINVYCGVYCQCVSEAGSSGPRFIGACTSLDPQDA